MKRNLILATMLTAVSVSAAGLAANAATTATNNGGMTEEQMFQAAKVKMDQASQIALKEAPGTLSAIGFNDENGKGVWEAMVIGADGKASIVKIDADSGAVLGKGLAANFDDEDGEQGHGDQDGDHDGEGGEGGEG
ncbi:PepSY domain-containing protein [Albidovulum sp.]